MRTRMEQGRKLRSMYRELGHDRTSAAKFFRITPRTLFNWEAGRTSIPFAAFKLLRLMLRSELPGKDWQGWCFNQGTLWSPEGHGYTPRDFGWLSLTIRQARLFSVLYRERCALQLELRAAKVEAAQAQAQAAAAEGHFGLVELAIDGGLPDAPGANDGAFSAWARSAAARAARSAGGGAADGRVLVTPPGGLTGEIGSPSAAASGGAL